VAHRERCTGIAREALPLSQVENVLKMPNGIGRFQDRVNPGIQEGEENKGREDCRKPLFFHLNEEFLRATQNLQSQRQLKLKG
jgi:hypothetical protein